MAEIREVVAQTQIFARNIRRNILSMAYHAGSSSAHIGGAMSLADILGVLFGGFMNIDNSDPEWVDRDRFILSKGHGCLAYYAALSEIGYIPREELNTFEKTGSRLLGHPIMDRSIGIDFSNGSLGMGLSLGIGVALAARWRKKNHKVIVVLGDGECNEGSVWEAAMSASHYGLSNLMIVVDHNSLQQTGRNESIMDLRNLVSKWSSFGWNALDIDGHDHGTLMREFNRPSGGCVPRAFICRTVKGRGVRSFEGDNSWHHAVLTRSHYETALAEINRVND